MPYRISETKDGFNVVNTETGAIKNAKPYLKRDDALQYQRALSAAENQTTKDTGFTVFKAHDGQYRWVLISSNAYLDRDNEIVSQKALQADVDRADTEKDFGPLRWWHIPGMELGDCEFNMLHGKMLIEAGTFRTPEIGQAISEKAGELAASIGFNHPHDEPDANGVFHHIRRFERSLLPKGRASNRFTSLAVTKGDNMSTLEDKVKEFFGYVGDVVGKQVTAQADSTEKELDALGVTHKETVTTTPAPDELVEKALETPEGEAKPDPMMVLMEKIDALAAALAELKANYAKDEATEETAVKEYTASLKAYGDKLATIEGQQAALAKQQAETITTLQEAQKEVRILMGDLPKGVGAFIASNAKETEVDDEDERLKSAPSQDPNANHDFMNFLLPHAGFPAQGNH